MTGADPDDHRDREPDRGPAAVVRRYFEAVERADADALADVVAADVVDHDPPGNADVRRGLDAYRSFIATVWAGFPDATYDVGDVVADGDRVAVRFTMTGTHRGEIAGVAPTGETVTVPGIVLFRVADGAIAERWGGSDTLTLLRQLGAAPDRDGD